MKERDQTAFLFHKNLQPGVPQHSGCKQHSTCTRVCLSACVHVCRHTGMASWLANKPTPVYSVSMASVSPTEVVALASVQPGQQEAPCTRQWTEWSLDKTDRPGFNPHCISSLGLTNVPWTLWTSVRITAPPLNCCREDLMAQGMLEPRTS